MEIQNISLDKEPIKLKNGLKYIVIDALYINDVKQMLSTLNGNNIISEMRSKVFPYTDTAFAEYTPVKDSFTLNQIKKVDYDQIESSDTSILSSDSGALIFINEKIFLDFISEYNYNELVNTEIDLINTRYWSSLVSSFNLFDVAVIVSPGINSGVEFDGSGSYRIT
ncbi:hypothetical protein ACTJIJ_22360 [Niabella sp. 22666]|uniref:hypothetical protein n=1 Tax=Niabella sp. 22666 TaxID=3453954 RepID=UPI003F844358